MIQTDNVDLSDEKHDNSFSWYTDAERSSFASIDREQENKDIICFQKTKDNKLFEKIYNNRIPTLQIWARRHQYLMDSQEDMFGELCLYFVKAVFTYDSKRGSFNTCLFTYLLNCIRNLQIGKRAKKRIPIGIDPNSLQKFILSLDYNYDGKDGSENTLKDVLANSLSTKDSASDKMSMDETVKILSNGNRQIVGWLKKLGEDGTIASVIKECNVRKGKINIGRSHANQLNKKRLQKRVVAALIKKKTNIQDSFSVINYTLTNPGKLLYTIEMKKTQEADFIMKTIRKIRKDEKNLKDQINLI